MSAPPKLATAVAAVLGFATPVRAAPDPELIRRELEKVYARPEFSTAEAEFWRRIGDWLKRTFGWLGTLSDADPILFWLILGGCLVVLALVVAHIVWTVLRVMDAGNGMRGDGVALAAQRQQMSARYRTDAEERARAGDYTEAVRLLFLSLVYAFDESGTLLFRPTLTNREYLRFFTDRPGVEEPLRFYVDLLDVNWYGRQSTEAADYAHCRTLYDTLSAQGAI